MKKYLLKKWADHPKGRKIIGIFLIIIGLLSIITPFTPAGFLLIVGLEALGLRALFWDKIKKWFKREI